MEKEEHLKEIEFPCNQEEEIAVYFAKLHKDQERLEKYGIIWDESQKVTQAVDKIYSSRMFGKDKMINWEDKADTYKTWAIWKSYFKEL